MKVLSMSSGRENHCPSIVGMAVPALLTSVAAMTIVCACFTTAALRAQDSPAVAVSRIDGDWLNIDPNTQGIVKILIDGKKIHPYGACHSTACDWGTIKARSFAPGVQSSDVVQLVAKKNNNFDQVEITLSLESDGRLRADVFTHFTDGSGRADYSTVNYFAHGRWPYTP